MGRSSASGELFVGDTEPASAGSSQNENNDIYNRIQTDGSTDYDSDNQNEVKYVYYEIVFVYYVCLHFPYLKIVCLLICSTTIVDKKYRSSILNYSVYLILASKEIV